jgi:peptide/nickel transport system substrate-binding protein
MYMRIRKGLLGLTAVGLAAALVAPAASAVTATTKKKAAAKTKPKTTTKPTTAPTTAKPAAGAAAPVAAKTGGKAVWGLEAESSQGFLPSSSNCAISCYQVFTSMAERLLSVDKDGKIGPWLAESITNDPTYRVWTIKLKSGIKFHNGEAFDAAAAKVNIDDFACGSVTISAWFPLNGFGQLCRAGKLTTGVEAVDATTVRVSLPIKWVSLPAYLASGQTYMMAPSQINAKERNKPIGTGAFKFKEWIVGERLNVVRNADYWGTKANLDEIEFRPIPDESARIAQLQSGQVDFMQTSNMLTIGELKDLAKGNKIKFSQGSPTFGEVSYDMLNVGVAPFNTKECRLAAAYGQDVETLIKLRAPGSDAADGPFAPGSLGHLPDSGYPKFNLDKAKEFFAKCKAALGGGDVSFVLGTTTVPDNIQTAQIQKQMMEQVGFKVSLVNIEQQNYIGVALVGAYQWFQWRSHGGFDPDQQRVWWHNEMNPRDPSGKLVYDQKTISINLNRISDSTIDDAFDKIRQNSDPAVRKKAAENINQAMADNAYSLWRWRTVWGVGYCTKCGGVTAQKTPTGAGTQDFPTGLVFDLAAITKG